MTLSLEPLQIVEIDIDYCDLVYGAGACTAVLGTDGAAKCFNTFKTCQDKPNFAKGTKTIRFAMNQSGIPGGVLVYPAMSGPVTTNPATINLGGSDSRTGALGKRARVTINLQDFLESDLLLDKYQSQRQSGAALASGVGYDPYGRGTFFGRLRARFPYYVGRALRVKEGYVGQALASMVTRNYIIDEWDGPDINGRVTIIAKDVLDLADNKKALVPAPSQGKLGADISDSYLGTVTLTPPTVGDDYAASSKASIGSEVVTFTRAGDIITITGRGLNGSDAASHSEGDLFQQCYVVEGQTIPAIAEDVLVNFCKADPSFPDTPNWDAEASRWLQGFLLNAVITKPTGALDIITELCHFGVVFWWDDVAQLIRMRANRPADFDETIPDITDRASIIEGSLGSKDLTDARISRVLFWHGQIDVTGSPTGGANFRRVFVPLDASSEGPNEYNQVSAFEVFSRWLGAGDDSVAGAVASRLQNRYRDIPKEIQFDVDVKDRDLVKLAALIRLDTRALQSEDGSSLPTVMQITAVDEVNSGSNLRISARTFEFPGRYGFIAEDARPNYDASSAAQKAKGTYFVGGSGVFSDGSGPYIMF